jgi:hypothetical protein
MCNVPTSSPTAISCNRELTDARSSKDVIFACAAFSSIDGWKEESVKSHTNMFPSAHAVKRTAGRVVDQQPAVRYELEIGELKIGFDSPNYKKWQWSVG